MLALYAFGSKMSLSPTAQQAAIEKSSLSESALNLESEHLDMSWCEFLVAIFSFSDTTRDLEPSSILTESLLTYGSDENVRAILY